MHTIFIDGQYCKMNNPPAYPAYVSMSNPDVYDIPEELGNPHDRNFSQEKVDMYANNRHLYPVIGQALIGFDEDGKPDVINSKVDNIQFVYPTV